MYENQVRLDGSNNLVVFAFIMANNVDESYLKSYEL